MRRRMANGDMPNPGSATSPTPLGDPDALLAAMNERAGTNQRTAKRAAELLLSLDDRYVVPTPAQRTELLVAFARARLVAYGKAFDILRCPRDINLNDAEAIRPRLSEILVCEIKSTNKLTVRDDFGGYFFSITGGEMLTAQSLGDQYRFIFVNTQTRRHLELSLRQVFARARGLYPAWSVQF